MVALVALQSLGSLPYLDGRFRAVYEGPWCLLHSNWGEVRGPPGLCPGTPAFHTVHLISWQDARPPWSWVPSICRWQLYLPFSTPTTASLDEATHRVVDCIRELRSWMIINKLKFNDDKTVALLLCHPKQQARLDVTTNEGGSSIFLSQEVPATSLPYSIVPWTCMLMWTMYIVLATCTSDWLGPPVICFNKAWLSSWLMPL